MHVYMHVQTSAAQKFTLLQPQSHPSLFTKWDNFGEVNWRWEERPEKKSQAGIQI